MSRARQAGLLGIAAGIVGAGVAAGLAAERRVIRQQRGRPDPEAREAFGMLRGRPRTVYANDGVPIHVEEYGQVDGPLTVVFAHGFTLRLDCWYYQLRDLGDVGRIVAYDHRGHGASGRGPREHATIDQLGRDLHAVINATAPTGPIVLVGHSMGGMTIMALADQHPELFGTRIRGVALIGTSPGAVGETIFGIPATVGRALKPVSPRALDWIDRRAALVERGRRAGSDLAYGLTKFFSYGSDVPPSLVQFMERMVSGMSFEAMSEFFPTFVDHDKLQALDVLHRVETLVVVGEKDRMTPVHHSRNIARAVPGAELIVLRDAGHMVQLERPRLVNLHLRAFIARALDRLPRRASA
jgi:pimeloyl-ACP methyl ester carboxylesterase